MKTIIHVVGNRPQFVKLAVLYKELFATKIFEQKIIHTGQHYNLQMSDIFFSELNIPEVDVQLNCSSNNYPDAFIAQASILLQEYFAEQKGSIAFVYGDTNTTLAAAIAATRIGLPLIHFEAGIRTGNSSMPEEINRVLTDRLAQTNYCCTQNNFSKMVAEGYGSSIKSRVLLSGDLMYDAFLKMASPEQLPSGTQYVLATIHRAGNILYPNKLAEIMSAFNRIHKEIPVKMPLHPHTQKRIKEYGLHPQFTILEPVGYLQMQKLLRGCHYVITDSGGVAREAFFSQKKSIIIMDKPFWPEIIEEDCSINVAADSSEIEKSFHKLPSLHAKFSSPIFGNGTAAKFIKEDLLANYA